ncbi:hypothetical protein MUG91_G194n25 [Manis pentadactyla]|nr:hypothetical protein MUG91_G194n25 [Manis pentadactyla]
MESRDWTLLNTGAKIIKADIGFTRQDAIEEHVCGGSTTLRRLKTERPEATPWLSETTKLFLLTLAVLVLLSQVIPGRTEKCWNLHGSCHEKCIKNEKKSSPAIIHCPRPCRYKQGSFLLQSSASTPCRTATSFSCALPAMKSLFLFLAILLVMEPVASAGWKIQRCQKNYSGHCRRQCLHTERENHWE